MSSVRQDAYHRKFVSMRNALRSIIHYNGECYRRDEPNNPSPCECPICLAKAALEGEEDWRFQGYRPDRRETMPREHAIHAAWKAYFTHTAGKANGTTGPMDQIFAQIIDGAEKADQDTVTERDWYIATTVVQWLATNVGQCILFDAGYAPKPAHPSDDYSPRELRLIRERDEALVRAEKAEASIESSLRSRH